MSTTVTELVVPLRGSKLRAASRREVRAVGRRTWSDTRHLSAYRSTQTLQAQIPKSPEVLVQATGWRRNAQGKIELFANKSMVQVQQPLTCAAVGNHEENPRFLRKAEKAIKHAGRQIYKKEKGKNQRRIARQRYARKHLRVSRQREEHSKRLGRCVCKLNSLVVYEDLNVKNMVLNHCLAKSINDVSWGLFRRWLEYFAVKFNSTVVAVNPSMTSQKCSDCGIIVKKSLSTRTHKCSCGCELQRDINAAKNILNLASSTLGHKESNATGVGTSTLVGVNLLEQVLTVNVESPPSMYS